MVYRRISPDMKQRSLQLIDEGWEMEDVANVLGVASKSIRWWTDNYDMHRHVDPLLYSEGTHVFWTLVRLPSEQTVQVVEFSALEYWLLQAEGHVSTGYTCQGTCPTFLSDMASGRFFVSPRNWRFILILLQTSIRLGGSDGQCSLTIRVVPRHRK